MMKFAALALSLFLLSTPSLAKRTVVQRALDGQRLSQLQTQTATKSVLVHVLPRAQRRLLVINEIGGDGNDNPAGPDELDLQGLYALPRLAERKKDLAPADNDDSISDYAMIRLAVARARAMEIYRAKFSENV